MIYALNFASDSPALFLGKGSGQENLHPQDLPPGRPQTIMVQTF